MKFKKANFNFHLTSQGKRKGSFTPDPALHVASRFHTARYGAAVAAFTLEFPYALHCSAATGGARRRTMPCRAVPNPCDTAFSLCRRKCVKC